MALHFNFITSPSCSSPPPFATLLHTSQKQKQHLRAQMETAAKTRDAVRTSLKDLKANMKYTTVEQIDEAIEGLESRIQHSSLSLNEEKKVLDDIRKLKASRAAVGEYSEKLETLAQDDSTRSELQSGIKALDEELSKIRAEEDVLRQELTEIREKEQETGSDIPTLLAEKDECREVCKQAYEKIKDLRAEHDAVWQEFKAQEKLWRVQQDEERVLRREEAVAERAARDAERAARLAEMAPEPFDKEVTMCEQLTAYLGRFVAAQPSAATAATAADAKPVEVANLEGMKVFARKGDGDDAWMTSGLGAGAKKGKGKGKKNATGAAAASATPAAGKIVHSLDMLGAFSTLQLAVPTTTSDVPAILAEVGVKKDQYLKKREAVKAAKENQSGDAEAAAAAGDAANGSGTTPADEHATEAEASSLDAPSSSSAAATRGAPKKKSGGKKGTTNAAAPPKLDDVALWPAVGAGPGSNGVAAVDETKPTAADVAKGTSCGGGGGEATPIETDDTDAAPATTATVVAMDVCEVEGVSLKISPPSEEE